MKTLSAITAACLPLILLSPTARSADTSDLIRKGDAAAAKFDEEQALKHYLAALKLSPEDPYLNLAISREYRHLMSEATSDKEKLHLGYVALRYAEKAAALGPADTDAQLAPAITYGKMLSLFDDSKTQLESSKKLKTAADKAVALDPNNDLAWHILGRWHRGIAEVNGLKRVVGNLVYGKMPTSTYANAAKCFNKAIALRPDRLMHHIELGSTYHKMGDIKRAKLAIIHGLALPSTEKDDPETKKRGAETLSKLK